MNGSIFKRLFWAAAAATALLGTTIAFTTGVEDPNPVVAGLFGVCLGLTMVFLTAEAVVTGEVRLRSRRARREDSPWSFWIAVGLYALAGAAITLGALGHMFGI